MATMLRRVGGLRRQPWALSFVAVVIIWVAIRVVSGKGTIETMEAALSVAPFLIIVGTGQLFIITLGNGNIDLSIPNGMAVGAFVGVSVMSGSGNILLGFAAAIGCGLAISLVNLFNILVLGIPPIVATLATGLLAATASFVEASRFSGAVPGSLRAFVSADIGGVSWLAIICIVFSIGAGIVLVKTRYGRSVQAIGQSGAAASLADVATTWVIARAYLASGVLAASGGVLLGAYTGVALGMGDAYLLTSIIIVVLGGSLIAGGRSNIPGIWGGALFLSLLVTLLNVLQLSAAYQDIAEGAVIIAVLAIGGMTKAR
jgi:ribose transport system permease protein